MTTITIKIDERNKAAKGLIDFIKTLSFVKIEKDNYNKDFVKKILDSDKNDKRIRINAENIWDSI